MQTDGQKGESNDESNGNVGEKVKWEDGKNEGQTDGEKAQRNIESDGNDGEKVKGGHGKNEMQTDGQKGESNDWKVMAMMVRKSKEEVGKLSWQTYGQKGESNDESNGNDGEKVKGGGGKNWVDRLMVRKVKVMIESNGKLLVRKWKEEVGKLRCKDWWSRKVKVMMKVMAILVRKWKEKMGKMRDRLMVRKWNKDKRNMGGQTDGEKAQRNIESDGNDGEKVKGRM